MGDYESRISKLEQSHLDHKEWADKRFDDNDAAHTVIASKLEEVDTKIDALLTWRKIVILFWSAIMGAVLFIIKEWNWITTKLGH